jgi:hypothetical protein
MRTNGKRGVLALALQHSVLQLSIAAAHPRSLHGAIDPLPWRGRMGEGRTMDSGIGANLMVCPGRKPPKRVIKRPARSYKMTIQN